MQYDPIVSKNIRCRVPEAFNVGEGSVVDDFCYFATQVFIGRFCHIANGVSIAGGKDQKFVMGNFSSVSAGVKVWCRSEDFTRDMAALAPPGIVVPKHTVVGDVALGELTIIGSNSVIMPNNDIPAGVAIGALSFVPPGYAFEEWYVYAGIPLRAIRRRDRGEATRQKDFLLQQLEEHRNHRAAGHSAARQGE